MLARMTRSDSRNTSVRPAVTSDFDEIARLIDALGNQNTHDVIKNDDWHGAAKQFFADAIAKGEAVVMVVDDPEEDGRLIATGVGVVTRIQPTYWVADGRIGYLQSFYTEPAWRNSGVATEITRAVLRWFDAARVKWITLHAMSDQSEQFFIRRGFRLAHTNSLWALTSDVVSYEQPSQP